MARHLRWRTHGTALPEDSRLQEITTPVALDAAPSWMAHATTVAPREAAGVFCVVQERILIPTMI